jgi:hypothetical protein
MRDNGQGVEAVNRSSASLVQTAHGLQVEVARLAGAALPA